MPETSLSADANRALLGFLGTASEWRLTEEPSAGGVDFVLESTSRNLAVEVRRSSEVTSIRDALRALEEHRTAHPKSVPLVATLYMGPAGKALCAEKKIGWFDLSGNADISAPNLRILIEGKPNRFKRPGRASSIFSPKAARIVRWLLIYGDSDWTQHQLTEGTRLDKGYASRVLATLRGQALIRQGGGGYTVNDRDLLLKAWESHYDFSKHRCIKGVMPARSGEEAMRKIASVVGHDRYAATGLAGAWFIDHFANFRTASVYLRDEPGEKLYGDLSFVPTEKGANVWLVRPNDEGVFDGRGEYEGVVCAHPVQVYLDLGGHPERAAEAAAHLRSTQLSWTNHA